jgi:transposase
MLRDERWYMIRNMVENGMKISEIAKELNIDRKTVKKYAKSKAVPRQKQRKKRSLKLEPYMDYIKERIAKYNLSAVRILEEIRKKGYTGSYSTLKAYCKVQRKDRAIKAVIRYETEPGKQAQVDFGEFGHVVIDGKRKKQYAFSYILGYSRFRYVEYTVDISTQSLIKLHINAFRYTGGVPSEILYDNMKQIVIDRKIKASESTFNRAFVQLSEYYGFNIRLCWPYRPQTKGKVERNIGYVRWNFFNGRAFESFQDTNAQCMAWLVEANGKVNATTGKIPAMALKEETLVPIGNTPEFTYNISDTRMVSRECYVHYNSNRYSVPWKYAGRNCIVTEQNGKLRISIDNDIIEHEILPGSGAISRNKEHFEGLLKAVRDQNVKNYSVDVEKRDLKEYEVD